MSFPWTEALEDQLLGMLDRDGLSCSQAAQSMSEQEGVVVSRNAIIGKATRLRKARGIKRPKRPTLKSTRTEAKRPARRQPSSLVASSDVPASDKVPLRAKAVPIDRPKAEPITATDGQLGIPLMDAGPGQWRWPVNDDTWDLRVCGATCLPGRSFCAAHAAQSVEQDRTNRADRWIGLSTRGSRRRLRGGRPVAPGQVLT